MYKLCVFRIHWECPVFRSLHSHSWYRYNLRGILTHYDIMHLKYRIIGILGMTHLWVTLNKLPWFDRFSWFLHHSLNPGKTTSLTEYLLFYLCLLVSLHLKNFTHYHVLIFIQIIPLYHGSHINFIHYLVIVWFWGAGHCRSRFAHSRIVIVSTKRILGPFASKMRTLTRHQSLIHCWVYWGAAHSWISSHHSLIRFLLSL